MSLFIFTFFLLYGGMHLYLFFKISEAFSFGFSVGSLIALYMLIMVFTPFIVWVYERAGHVYLATAIAWIGYLWMAAIFLFFSASILIDLFRALCLIGGWALKSPPIVFKIEKRVFFLVPAIASILIVFYGYYEAKAIKVERIEFRTDKISRATGRIRICQLSDIHLGLMVGEERLKAILKEVEMAVPDILVATGDIVDGQHDRVNALVELFKGIRPPLGKFACTGNHEFYAGIGYSMEFMERAGFIVLRGSWATPGGILSIAGVDDVAGRPYASKGISEGELLSGIPKDRFTVLLKHRPVVDKDAEGLFDIQLSGHTHMGQIFPFRYITRLVFPMYAGLFKLKKGGYLYTNRGVGTWGPPVRFLAPPEVTLIEIVPE
jgi:hypothetical protein